MTRKEEIRSLTFGTLLDFCVREESRLGIPRRPLFMFRREKPPYPLELSAGELQSLAFRIATLLDAREVTRGDKVAILGKPSAAWAVAFFGVSRLGAVPVLLDFQASPDEISYAMGKAGAKVLIAHSNQKRELEGLEEEMKIIFLSQDPETLDTTLPEADPSLQVSSPALPEDLGVVFFSSGTTGPAKAIGLSHSNVITNAAAAIERFKIGPSDRILSIAPWSHSMGFTCTLILPLLSSATVLYTDVYEMIMTLIPKYHINIVLAVPRFYAAFARRLEQRVKRGAAGFAFKHSPHLLGRILKGKYLIPDFRFFVSGSAPLDEKVVRLFERLGLGIVEGYGLTECSPIVSATEASRPIPGSVGQPLPGIQVKLANINPEGIGELCVKGPNVTAYGYLGDPEKTAALIDEEGWLHTGDLAKIDEEGNIYILGRADDLIVLPDGRNVYPTEIEPLLAASPLVEELMVFHLPKESPFIRVAVFPNQEELQRRGIDPRNKAEIRRVLWEDIARLQAQLASYKQISKPAHILVLPQPLPKTSTLDIKRNEALKMIKSCLEE